MGRQLPHVENHWCENNEQHTCSMTFVEVFLFGNLVLIKKQFKQESSKTLDNCIVFRLIYTIIILKTQVI